ATPVDGLNPRMQMFLWTGKGDHQVVVNTGGAVGIYRAQGAIFGPALDPTGITGDVALVNDGTAPVTDACQALPANSLSGQIALIDRGACTFVVKVKNAQNARSEEHTSELQSLAYLVCRLLLEKKKKKK